MFPKSKQNPFLLIFLESSMVAPWHLLVEHCLFIGGDLDWEPTIQEPKMVSKEPTSSDVWEWELFKSASGRLLVVLDVSSGSLDLVPGTCHHRFQHVHCWHTWTLTLYHYTLWNVGCYCKYKKEYEHWKSIDS